MGNGMQTTHTTFYIPHVQLSHYQRTNTKKALAFLLGLSLIWRLAMTYSHMGKPHTTIGEAAFHF